MTSISVRILGSAALLASLMISGSVQAQTDRLYPKEAAVVIGKIKTINKDEVVMTVAGKDQSYISNNIVKLLFQGEPQGLTQARDFIADGQYDKAAQELQQVDIANLPREVMKTDAQFYLVLSQSRMALTGQGDLNKATADMLAFVTRNPNSWHYYSAARTLGDLAKALGNYERAAQFYGALRTGPARDLQIESVYQRGMVKFAQDDLDGAKTELNKVAGLKPTSAEERRLQTLAKAGLAVIAAKQGEGDAALKMVNDLIATLSPTDTQTAAMIYNAQGASYQAVGDDEGALLAYLHTQLMYSMHATEHVEALKQLIELWTKVGKPDRAAQARGELQQRYPGLSS